MKPVTFTGSIEQTAALKAMQDFVQNEGGDIALIRQIDDHYKWTAPDGRVAAVGWLKR